MDRRKDLAAAAPQALIIATVKLSKVAIHQLKEVRQKAQQSERDQLPKLRLQRQRQRGGKSQKKMLGLDSVLRLISS
jgi:hypothetical protein